jgi:hypothetical protein
MPDSEARRAIGQASEWLRCLSVKHVMELAPADAMLTLIGLWLGDITHVNKDSESLGVVANRLQQLLDDSDQDTVGSGHYDTRLLLISDSILRYCGLASAQIEVLARKLAADFEDLDSTPDDYLGESFLLSKRGLLPGHVTMPVDLSLEWKIGLGGISAQRTHVQNVCRQIEGATGFGTFPIETSRLGRVELEYRLNQVLIGSLHSYDIELAAAVLRSLVSIQARDSRSVREALRFLLLQQWRDGRFGFLSTEVRLLAGKRSPVEPVARRVYLQSTVACMWAIAMMLRDDWIVHAVHLFTGTEQAA